MKAKCVLVLVGSCALCLCFVARGETQGVPLPSGARLTGGELQGQWILAKPENGGTNGVARLEGEIPQAAHALEFVGKVGTAPMGYAVNLSGPDGVQFQASVQACNTKIEGFDYRDGCLMIGVKRTKGDLVKSGVSRYWIRSNPKYVDKAESASFQQKWDSLPAASQAEAEIRVALKSDEVEIWIDGQLMASEPVPTESLKKYVLEIYPGAGIRDVSWSESSKGADLILPIGKHPKLGDLLDPVLKLDDDKGLPDAFRAMNGRPAAGIYIGELGIFDNMRTDDLQSMFWRRHASDGLERQRMFSVPLAVYKSAKILCAVKKGSAADESQFTLRVTRYANSRGDAMADSLVVVPEQGSKATPDARKVGKVAYGKKDAREEADLWLITVPIKSGRIQDLIFDDERKNANICTPRYLDVELLVPLENIESVACFPPPLQEVSRTWMPNSPRFTGYDYYKIRSKPRTSAVTVFGVELDESPASIRVLPAGGNFAFYQSEKPALQVNVAARKAGNYTLQWETSDIEGNTRPEQSMPVEMEVGGSQSVKLPLDDSIGWHAFRVRLLNGDGELLTDFQSSYAVLMPDTRKAGYESPFVAWWFAKNHASDIKLEEIGPLIQRLGIRHADLLRLSEMKNYPESSTSKYGFTRPIIGFANEGGGRALAGYVSGKYNLDEAVEMHRNDIKEHLALWPSIDRMMVFHESTPAGAPFPTELWGEPVNHGRGHDDEASPQALLQSQGQEADKASQQRDTMERVWPKRMEYLFAMAKMVRKEFPGLKMQYGNDGNSLETVGEIFRQKFPRSLMDTISVEDLGQTIAPERALVGGLHSAWFLRELARKMGYGDVPVTACTEWLGRMTQRLGLERQAEWEVRDALISLAYGFDTISIAGINDAGDGYFYSIWGNGGLNFRYPYLAPKPAYVAVATLTQMLDRAHFERMVPTGSSVLYVAEFKRNDQWVYAVWTPRGKRETSLTFLKKSDRQVIDLYGRSRTLTGRAVTIDAGTAAQYLVSPDRVVAAVAGKCEFPESQPPEHILEEIPVDSLDLVEVATEPWLNRSKTTSTLLPRVKPGKFEVREVLDEEMGKCLEIELIPEGDLWDFEHEYIALKLKTPHPTGARNAGVWIKGNGSWGDVDIWKSRPWGPWASQKNLQVRYGGMQSLNFDGWNLIQFPYYDWVRNDPNQVLGIMLTMPRKVIVGSETEPVRNLKIRIKKIVLF